MDLDNIKAKQEYIGGIVFDKYSLRKHKLTLQSEDEKINGLVLIAETKTPKTSEGRYGMGETDYYWDAKSPMFKTPKEAIEWKLKSI